MIPEAVGHRTRRAERAQVVRDRDALEPGVRDRAQPPAPGALSPQPGEQPDQVLEVAERLGDHDAGGLRELAQ